jgi:dihydroorotate dehydrogenase (NAD+) catalytic subunit
MTAAGTYGFGLDLEPYGSLATLGAFVTKSLSLHPRKGNTGKNLIPTSSGAMLNSVGLRNPGLDAWINDVYPALSEQGVHIVVSLWAETQAEFRKLAGLVADLESVRAVELNLSCPNVKGRDKLVSHDPALVADYVKTVVEELTGSHVAVWAKLAPSTPDIVQSAQAADSYGASAVTLINTLPGMEVDVASKSIPLSGGYGGLSGAPLHPIAMRAVYQVHQALPRLPIIGVGGVVDVSSAVKLMAVGASAVQIGTASFRDPRAPFKILRALERWLQRRGLEPAGLTGCIRADRLPDEM